MLEMMHIKKLLKGGRALHRSCSSWVSSAPAAGDVEVP